MWPRFRFYVSVTFLFWFLAVVSLLAALVIDRIRALRPAEGFNRDVPTRGIR